MPQPSELSDLEQHAQVILRRLVEGAGGRFDSSKAIPASHLELLAPLFHDWAVRHGDRLGDGVQFDARPGLWQALDELYPLQDPNRWDGLRREIIRHLEARGWVRRRPPRGAAFDIPLQVGTNVR